MINRVVLVGRLTRDIEIKKTQSNLSVANFSVAVDNRTKDDQGNKTTSFINCIAWRQSAEYLAKYSHKGSLVGIEGRLQQRSYVRKDGTNANVLEVVVDSVTLLESKGQSESRYESQSSAPIDEPDVSEEKTDTPDMDVTVDDDLPF